jgi:cation transport regulator
MPYRSNSDLPASVQAHLPPHAQDIYRKAFNMPSRRISVSRGRRNGPTASPGRRSSVKVGGSWIGRTGRIDLSLTLPPHGMNDIIAKE